jgi:hypothetical protein
MSLENISSRRTKLLTEFTVRQAPQVWRKLNSNGINSGGRDSSVGIATGYELDGPGIGKISRWGARFFAHVETGRGTHPPPSSAEAKKE